MADSDPHFDTASAVTPAEALPSMAYRAYFLLLMVLVSASVQGERYLMVVMVEPIRHELGLSDAAIGMAKTILNESYNQDFRTLLEMEAMGQSLVRETEFHREAVRRFKEKETPLFDWDRN